MANCFQTLLATPHWASRSCLPGGSDCLSLSALSESVTQSVYRYLEHRTLNLVTGPVFLIFTDRASFRRAVSRKSLISWICFGCSQTREKKSREQQAIDTSKVVGFVAVACMAATLPPS